MQRFIYHLFFAVLSLCAAAMPAHAEGNLLGLPAVPQAQVASPASVPAAAAPASGASAAKPQKKSASAARSATAASSAASSAAGAPAAPTDNDIKSVLNGGVTMASSYTGTVATVKVVTNAVYKGDLLRSQALKAAKLVQRDVGLACGAQCKGVKMPAPLLQPSGKLEFDLSIDGLGRVLNQDDMVNLLLGRPLAVLPKVANPVVVTPTVVPGATTSESKPEAKTAVKPEVKPEVKPSATAGSAVTATSAAQ
jgi:hypothetical protein